MKRLVIAALLIIAAAFCVNAAAAASELASYELTFGLNGTAAGLEFFLELPQGASFVSLKPATAPQYPQDVRSVYKITSDGVWIGLYTDYNAYSDVIIPLTVTLRCETAPESLTVNERYAYRLKFSEEQRYTIAETSLAFLGSRRINAPPSTPVPSGGGEGNGGGGGERPGSAEPLPFPSLYPTEELDLKTVKVTFTDLENVPWAREAIEYLATYCGILGLGGGRFGPNEALTRAQFARFTAAAFGIDGRTSGPEFSDVNPGNWFYTDVTALAEFGIVEGYPDGTFRPDEPVTREQMAVMLLRALSALGYETIPVRPFMLTGDIKDASAYASSAIRSLYRAGIIEGMSRDTYAPRSGATRAEACVLLYRALRVTGRLLYTE